jgi:hypothetical protein
VDVLEKEALRSSFAAVALRTAEALEQSARLADREADRHARNGRPAVAESERAVAERARAAADRVRRKAARR